MRKDKIETKQRKGNINIDTKLNVTGAGGYGSGEICEGV